MRLGPPSLTLSRMEAAAHAQGRNGGSAAAPAHRGDHHLDPRAGLRQRDDLAHFQERGPLRRHRRPRSEEHTSELQSLMRISYAVFCLKKKKINKTTTPPTTITTLTDANIAE